MNKTTMLAIALTCAILNTARAANDLAKNTLKEAINQITATQSKQVTAPAQSKQVTAPAQSKQVTAPAQSKQVTAPAQSKQATATTQSKQLTSKAKGVAAKPLTSAQIKIATSNAVSQYTLMTEAMNGKTLNPRTLSKDRKKANYCSYADWTSGFYPGSMWYLFELTKDSLWLELAKAQSANIDSAKYLTWHHDIGFIIECSYGNGLRLTQTPYYKGVIVQAARSLSTRYRPVAGVIQSWNTTGGWQKERGWECPVIIDNMMNLELLFNATKLSGDTSFRNIAITHANTTLREHYRPDGSCYHVIDYSLKDGSVRSRQTAQGFAHSSAWSRGQAWGIYGFTVCFRETGDQRYLDQAISGFDFMKKHKSMPKDKIPYWDMDADSISKQPRDASSAAIMASALYEMARYDKARSQEFIDYADWMMNSLSSPAYTAKRGTNGNFILMHSVGSIPHNAEIDVPLNYADYYYLEALRRRAELLRAPKK